jgi:hypothetical protein
MQAVLLGSAVLTGVAVGGVGLFAVGNQQWLWKDTFCLRAGFRQIRGVEIGTGIRVLGRRAGEVAAIKLPGIPSGEIMLRLKLDGDVRHLIRADASVQIVPEGMVGGKVLEIDPGSDAAEPVADNAIIVARSTTEWTDVLGQVGAALHGIGNGEGSLGKLVHDDHAYEELLGLLRQGQGTMTSLKQNADALKAMPIVRSYVRDPLKELVRPDCRRDRQWYRETDLFEPGHAVLTGIGKKRLDDLAPWVKGFNTKGSEVLVASFAAPAPDGDIARGLTQKQSEAVSDYLTGHHSIQKLGWFSRRKVTALGCGADLLNIPEKETLPVPRIEVLVFIPEKG